MLVEQFLTISTVKKVLQKFPNPNVVFVFQNFLKTMRRIVHRHFKQINAGRELNTRPSLAWKKTRMIPHL